mmetsp:Transcript_20621/g.57400  ORF Transcript_20621/g.57400 Transcript_20621/m.57400 type:complete len:215 (-) Transcript_20621:412-1056(-)
MREAPLYLDRAEALLRSTPSATWWRPTGAAQRLRADLTFHVHTTVVRDTPNAWATLKGCLMSRVKVSCPTFPCWHTAFPGRCCTSNRKFFADAMTDSPCSKSIAKHPSSLLQTGSDVTSRCPVQPAFPSADADRTASPARCTSMPFETPPPICLRACRMKAISRLWSANDELLREKRQLSHSHGAWNMWLSSNVSLKETVKAGLSGSKSWWHAS